MEKIFIYEIIWYNVKIIRLWWKNNQNSFNAVLVRSIVILLLLFNFIIKKEHKVGVQND